MLVSIAAVLLIGGGVAQLPESEASTRHYVIVFAAQDARNSPQRCHTWATFVSVKEQAGMDPEVDEETISWLPADYARTLNLGRRARTGRRFDCVDTISFMNRLHLCVRHWGPFEINSCLYEKAMRQAAYLDSGCVQYKHIEPLQRRAAYAHRGGSLHCIHSVTDVVGFVITGLTHGHASGSSVSNLYSPYRINRPAPAWLYDSVVRREGDRSVSVALQSVSEKK